MTSGPLGNSTASFRYDFNSNLIQAGNISYAYDLEDRLIAFTVNGAATSLINNPGAGFSQVLQKRPANGAVTNYVWGVGLAYEETGGQIRVYHYDHRGSTVAFSGNAGTVTGRVLYGPFGEIAGRSGDTDSLFLFGGLFGVITDPQGLNYMRFRWYSPQIKRFISQDAHFGDITMPGTLNRFAYAGNNPVSRIDPGGECWVCLGALIGAAVNVVVKAAGDLADDGKINDPWQEYAGAAIGGAISGAVLAACPGCGAAAGALGSAGEYLATQGFKGDKVDPFDLLVTTATGALSGGRSRGAAGLTRPRNYRFATYGLAPLVQRQGVHTLRQAGMAAVQEGIQGLDERFHLSAALKREGTAFLNDVSSGLSRFFGSPVQTAVVVTGRPLVLGSSRKEVNRRNKGIYGEYIHYQIWLDAMQRAGRTVPNNPNHVLTSF
jgi:RHS repeat-associated protein